MLKEYLAELQKTQLLEREQELELWRLYASGDKKAYTQLMSAYQPLVFKLAIAFKLPEGTTMELIQEGMVGLLEAAEHYEYERGIAFSIFATHRIRGRMLNFLKQEYDYRNVSLEDTNAAGVAWSELLPAEGKTPYEEIERSLIQDRVSEAMTRLPLKEQQVLAGIYLEDRTAGDMAELVNISRGHVYRLQKRGVRRIRGMLSKFIAEVNKD